MRNSFHAVSSGVSFHFGENSFVLNTDRKGAAAVIPGDIYVYTVDVPHLPQASLAVPWNGGLAVETRQLTDNGVKALSCFRVWQCRIQSEIQKRIL